MQLTTEQLKSADAGQAVTIELEGKTFILLSQSVWEELNAIEYGPMTPKERDRIRAETIAMLDDDLTEDDDEC